VSTMYIHAGGPIGGNPWEELRHSRHDSLARCIHTRTGNHELMAKAKESGMNKLDPVIEDADEKTLAGIHEGIRNAEAGRITPVEEVRKLLPKWITASSSRKER
jgi:predicted transcriptional regulator